MYAVEASHAPDGPAARQRHGRRVLGAIIALGSSPALRCWSGHWWPPPRSPVTSLGPGPRLRHKLRTIPSCRAS